MWVADIYNYSVISLEGNVQLLSMVVNMKNSKSESSNLKCNKLVAANAAAWFRAHSKD